jgi:hypothetical protein
VRFAPSRAAPARTPAERRPRPCACGEPDPDLARALWRKSTYSGGNGSYVEIADLGTAVAVRDSKDPDGPKLILTTGQWRSFTDSIKAGNHHP